MCPFVITAIHKLMLLEESKLQGGEWKASSGTAHYMEKWIQKINVMSSFDLPTSTLGCLRLFLCNSSKQETTQSYIMTTVTRESSSHAFPPGSTARDLNAFPVLELSLLCCLIVTSVWMSELGLWLLLQHQLKAVGWCSACFVAFIAQNPVSFPLPFKKHSPW